MRLVRSPWMNIWLKSGKSCAWTLCVESGRNGSALRGDTDEEESKHRKVDGGLACANILLRRGFAGDSLFSDVGGWRGEKDYF